MGKNARWLNAEIERWTTENIISADQAARIRALYAEPAGAVSWGLIVFFGIGAVVIGLGVILLFAYNWSAIPKFVKLALIFGALIAAHAAGLRLGTKPDWRAKLGEALSLLGTMAFGAGIWLIAQIYHIDEHFPNGFMIWALGGLAMAWAIGSVAHGILAAVLIAIWGGSEAMSFRSPQEIAAVLLVVGLAPLAWRQRSALLLAVWLAALAWLQLCNASIWGGLGAAFSNAFALSALLVAASRLIPRDRPAAESRVLRGFGLTGFLLCSFLLSFDDAAQSLLRWSVKSDEMTMVTLYRWLFVLLAGAAWAWLLKRRVVDKETTLVDRELWLCPIGLLYVHALAVAGTGGGSIFVALAFNLICLAVAAAWMVRGCREGRLSTTVLGSLFLAAIVFARYFDLFDSLAVRGVVFLIFGGILFAEGFYYRRLRREASAEGDRP